MNAWNINFWVLLFCPTIISICKNILYSMDNKQRINLIEEKKKKNKIAILLDRTINVKQHLIQCS